MFYELYGTWAPILKRLNWDRDTFQFKDVKRLEITTNYHR